MKKHKDAPVDAEIDSDKHYNVEELTDKLRRAHDMSPASNAPDYTIHINELPVSSELLSLVDEAYNDLRNFYMAESPKRWKEIATKIVDESAPTSDCEMVDASRVEEDPDNANFKHQLNAGPPSLWLMNYVHGWFIEKQLTKPNDLDHWRIENVFYRNVRPSDMARNLTLRTMYCTLQLNRFMGAGEKIEMAGAIKSMLQTELGMEGLAARVSRDNGVSIEAAKVKLHEISDISRIDPLCLAQDNFIFYKTIFSRFLQSKILAEFSDLKLKQDGDPEVDAETAELLRQLSGDEYEV